MPRENKYKKKENYRLWNIYHSMKKRCYNPNCKRYKDYGDRGITICDEWLESFDNFAEWSYANGYSDNLTIDRKDNNGNYEAGNCQWSTNKNQCRNTRKTVNIEYKGITKSLAEWCEELDLNYSTIHKRIKNGWSIEKTFETKSHQEDSFTQICKEHNINPVTVLSRIEKLGWDMDTALSTPTIGRGASAKDYGRSEKCVCLLCGKEFIKNVAIQKYCSADCREKANKLRRK